MPRHRSLYIVALFVLALVAAVYWPVIHADFVWDDVADFVDNNWLTYGDDWKHYIWRDFNNWYNYFRPLIVAFFALQLRVFGVVPGPMHAVNLALHLADTLLVGLLAWQVCQAAKHDARRTTLWVGFCMALYGLHPVLIEPVAWIGCQFDLAATLFMLLGLLAQTGIRPAPARALAVALCFLLAASCKESAAVFPLLLAVVEWAMRSRVRTDGLRAALAAFVRDNWLTYAALLAAGLVYLIARHWALGQLVPMPGPEPASFIGRMQEIAFLYLHYWRTLFWPTSGMGPVHWVDMQGFDTISAASLLTLIAALGLATGGVYFALRRASPWGCLITAMTVALLLVLHITSAGLDSSLYHERHVITGLAVCCALLPLVRLPQRVASGMSGSGRALLGVTALAWFGFSLFAIRTTVPLWSDSITLWRWALMVSPDSPDAKANLLAAYYGARDTANVYKLADQLLAEHTRCNDVCLLDIAFFYIAENHPDLAASALEQIHDSRTIGYDKFLFNRYLLATGQMLILQGHPSDAEPLLHRSIELDPHDPQSRRPLVTALSMQGKKAEARQAMEKALALIPPDQRTQARQSLEKIVESDPSRLQPAPGTSSPEKPKP